MAYFIVRLLVNSLSLFLMVALTPRLEIVMSRQPVEIILEFLLMGGLLAVAHWIVIPLVMLIAGGLVLWSFGLLMIVVNAIMLWFAAVVFIEQDTTLPSLLRAPGLDVVRILMAATILTVVLFVLEGVTGLDSPLKDGGARSRKYWRTLKRFTFGGRNFFAENIRFAASLDTISRYARDMLFDASFLAPIRHLFQNIIYRRRQPLVGESMAVTTRYMLQDLGPTFVKLGQIVSSRSDQLPPVWRSELAMLQSEVEPFDADVAQAIIERELGGAISELYADFDNEILAAASTAQVHVAHLHSGQKVVVKVQRPDIDVTVRADLNILNDLTKLAEQRFEWARKLDVHAIMTEYANNILLELDYTNEAYSGRLLADNMRLFPMVYVPAIYGELSTSKVMTQEFVSGVKITNIDALDAAGIDRVLLARTFVRAIVKQVIYDGFFHGDPHPGNILVDPANGRIIFLDMGMMGTLTREKRMALADLIWSLSERDGRDVARTVLRLTVSSQEVDKEAFVEDVERLLKRYTAIPDLPISVSGAMNSILDALARAHLRLDPDLTLALKSMIQAEETAHKLDPDLPLAEAALDATRDLLVETFDPDKLINTLRTQAIRSAKQAVRSIPSIEQAIGGWINSFQQGKFVLHLDGTDLTKQIEIIDRTISRNVRRVILAMLIVGLLIGGGIASTTPATLSPLLSQVAYFIFIGASVCAAAVIVRSLWRWLRGREI